MPDFDKNILITNIRALMKERNCIQDDLAKILHTTQPSISKAFNNGTLPFEYVFKIASHFNVSIDSLCIDHSNTPNTDIEDDELLTNEPPTISVYEICSCLAKIFKSATPYTQNITYRETVYKEECDEFGEGLGIHYCSGEKENIYNAIFFPNYCEPGFTYNSRDEFDEYMDSLRDYGNLHYTNQTVNVFLSKLIDLLTAFRKDSLSYNSYIFAIDENLSKIPKK